MYILPIILLIVASLLQAIAARRVPTIRYISPELVHNIGETAVLECSVKNAKYHPPLWLKSDGDRKEQLAISMKTTLLIQDSRFSISYNRPNTTYTLRIEDVKTADAGFYECQMPNMKNGTLVRAAVKLHVCEENSNESICSSYNYSISNIFWGFVEKTIHMADQAVQFMEENMVNKEKTS